MADGKLDSFLGAFKRIIFSGAQDRERILEIIKNESGITLAVDDISVKHGKLSVRASGAVKNHLFIKKEKILEAFKKEKIQITDISW